MNHYLHIKPDYITTVPVYTYIAGIRLHIHGWHSLFSIYDIFPGYSTIISQPKNMCDIK